MPSMDLDSDYAEFYLEDSDSSIDFRRLVRYFRDINRIYEAAVMVLPASQYWNPQDRSAYEPFVKQIAGLARRDFPDLSEKPLKLVSIQKNSPLSFLLGGWGPAIIAAVIISGGEFELNVAVGRIKVKLPPIGEGLQRIRDVFRNGNAGDGR